MEGNPRDSPLNILARKPRTAGLKPALPHTSPPGKDKSRSQRASFLQVQRPASQGTCNGCDCLTVWLRGCDDMGATEDCGVEGNGCGWEGPLHYWLLPNGCVQKVAHNHCQAFGHSSHLLAGCHLLFFLATPMAYGSPQARG